MNKICTIYCSINSHSFATSFHIKRNIPEYVIEDEAYRVALLFAQTQAIATFGCYYNPHQFTEFMKNLNYNYSIKEEDN